MESVSNVTIHPCENSKYIRPMRLRYHQNGVPKVWDAMKSHDSVCVLIYNSTRQVLVLVKQFRPAVYLSMSSEKEEDGVKKIDTEEFPGSLGISYELCAGLIDNDDSPIVTAQKEVLEECGYNVPIENFERVTSYRSGVGISCSKQTLFYAEVTDAMKISEGGGLAEEGELIEVIELPLSQGKGLLMDESKTKPVGLMFALMWFFDK